MSDVLKTERMKSELETYADDGKKLSLSELKALKSEFEERGYVMRFNNPDKLSDREIMIYNQEVYYKVNKKKYKLEAIKNQFNFERINLND